MAEHKKLSNHYRISKRYKTSTLTLFRLFLFFFFLGGGKGIDSPPLSFSLLYNGLLWALTKLSTFSLNNSQYANVVRLMARNQ